MPGSTPNPDPSPHPGCQLTAWFDLRPGKNGVLGAFLDACHYSCSDAERDEEPADPVLGVAGENYHPQEADAQRRSGIIASNAPAGRDRDGTEIFRQLAGLAIFRSAFVKVSKPSTIQRERATR